MKRRLMIALCCLVLLVQLLPIVSMAEAVTAAEVDVSLYYCREQLEDLPNGKALLYAYDNIVAGIDACAEEIIISNKQYQLTMDEFQLALEAVRRDHTEQFWLHTSYSYVPDSAGNIVKMLPQYIFVGAELEAAKVAFNQAIDNMIARLDEGMSEYEKEKTLHDLLATKVSYVSTANAHNAYGALVEGLAVCEGYAEALQCLLQRVGIQSIQVYGESKGENHAWNMVLIDGAYYLVDLTWNDQDTTLLYAYFNQTSAIFDEDHDVWRVGHNAQNNSELGCQVFELPTCTATAQNYFVKNNLVIDTRNTAVIGQMLKKNDLSVSVFIQSGANFTAEQFVQWCFNNASDIAAAAGVSGQFSIKGQYIGREAHIVIETCKHQSVTIVAAKAATCEEEGTVAHRKCRDCGKLFMAALDENGKLVEIFNQQSVIILPNGHDFTVKNATEATLKQKAEKCTEKDTYYLACSVCQKTSDAYTFQTEVTGEHNYPETWVADGVLNHKRVCANGCGIDLVEAHAKEDGADGCTVCGYKFSVTDLIPDIDAGETVNEIIGTILENPLVLMGGGGGVLLVVIMVIIKKIREG